MNPKFTIAQCTFQDVRHFAARAAKERVSITDTRDTIWHAAYDENQKIVGCGAVMIIRQSARLKAYFVEPEYRGHGIGNQLVAAGIRDGSADPRVNTIEVFSVNPPYFVALGFTRLNDIRDGVTHLTKRI